MSSSTISRGFTTKSETTLNLTRMKLLEISYHSSQNDFLGFLSLIQLLEINILPLVWYPSLHIGRGGFAVLNEAPVNKAANFVFKRLITLEDDSRPSASNFSLAAQEVAILRHYHVMKHPNILDFYGICWEVDPSRCRILPVLVLEKARYGDLYHFRSSEEGKRLSVRNKLLVCSQVAEGLAMLHASLIIHGDIKPQNILICQDDEGNLVAKIADFGSSRTGQTEDDMHELHYSNIWSAPEYHHRKFSIAAAKKMDAYRFALVCLWHLLDESQGAIDADSATRVLQSMKESCDIILRAQDIVAYLELESASKNRLALLLKTALEEDPVKRVLEVQALAQLLNPDQENDPMIYGGRPVVLKTTHVNFKISHNLYPLTFANYLVRQQIFQCFEDKATTSKCQKCMKRAAFELAFCYSIGFGTASDLQQAKIWTGKAGKRMEDLEDEKDEVIDYDLYSNPAVNSLRKQGFSMIMDHVNEYRGPGYDINTVIATLEREICDLDKAFEDHFMLTATLRGVLASVALGAGQIEVAEKIYQQIVDYFGQDPDHGPNHPDTWASQQRLAEILRQAKKIGAAEQLAQVCLTNRRKFEDEKSPGILECKATLGSTLFDAGRFEEAMELFTKIREDSAEVLGPEHPQTLFAMSNLACAYRANGLLSDAESLDLEVLNIKKRTLDSPDSAHFSTVTSAANLAYTYYSQERWDETAKLETWVLQERNKSLGELHPATLLAKKQLAETHHQREKALHKSAIEILEGEVDGRKSRESNSALRKRKFESG